ncbi:hypothetical protein EV714DRAFT_277938 [Schizophyllum commune]
MSCPSDSSSDSLLVQSFARGCSLRSSTPPAGHPSAACSEPDTSPRPTVSPPSLRRKQGAHAPAQFTSEDFQRVIADLEVKIEELEAERANTKVRIVRSYGASAQDVLADNFRLQAEIARLKSVDSATDGRDVSAMLPQASRPNGGPTDAVLSGGSYKGLSRHWERNYRELQARHQALLDRVGSLTCANSALEKKVMDQADQIARLERKIIQAKESLQGLSQVASEAAKAQVQLLNESRAMTDNLVQISDCL